jgi:pilus assembly protein Flp/PilA
MSVSAGATTRAPALADIRPARLERARVASKGKSPMLKKFLKDNSGATAIEYGLIAAGISLAIIATVQGLGTQLKSTFSQVSAALN